MPYPYTYPSYGAFNTMPPYNPQNFAPAPAPAPQTMQGGATSSSGFSCRPVTSRAEAEVFQIPFDGSTTYFVDTANGKIYSKTFNFGDGTAPLVTYIRESATPPVQYAPVDALDELRTDIDSLKAEIEAIKKPKKVVRRNDEYDDE